MQNLLIVAEVVGFLLVTVMRVRSLQIVCPPSFLLPDIPAILQNLRLDAR